MFYKAIDEHWCKEATQGGVVRGCASWLLEQGHIDKIVCVLKEQASGEFKWGCTDNPEDMAKSVYTNVNPVEFLSGYTERGNALFIGIPCNVASGFKYRINLMCSGAKVPYEDKIVIDYRHGHKPGNYDILYSDGSIQPAYLRSYEKMHPGCKNCNIKSECDMLVGDLHGTPYNLVETHNNIFDEYIHTIRHKSFTEEMFDICKINH